jgi:hydrogenase expression/formation protein HypE
MSSEPTAFLYPFIESEERDSTRLLVDLAASAREKVALSRALRASTVERCGDELEGAAAAMADRFGRGARLFAFGNGGSATDAEGAVDLLRRPPAGRPLPAVSLVDDRAVLTALANDVGFDLVFSRQIIAHAHAGDIAVGFSTSGDSVNVLRGLSHHRLLRLRGRRNGGQRGHHTLLRGALRERAPHTGGPERTDAAAVDDGAGSSGQREALVTDTARKNGSTVREAVVFDRIEAFRRRRPRLHDDVITLAHGAGGKASAALLDAVFLPAFADDTTAAQTDAALLTLPSGERLAFSTDSYVVKPLRFPGGSAGYLAVHGTVNDLAMMGARPLALAAAFVLEEGFPVAELREIVADMAEAAAAAGVRIVTGDTKVVDRGAADGMYISTAGVGVIPAGRELSAGNVKEGDVVLSSGTMGDHGTAVMLARGDLALEADIASDTAPLNDLMECLLTAAPSTRWLRDSTRGGVGTVCNELARDSNLTVVLEEDALPVRPAVAAACELLGIDPLYVANEGKLVAVVAPEEAEAALAALRAHPRGRDAAPIGEIRSEPPGIVVLRTTFGGTRIVDMLVGDPLPRIC